MLNAIAGRDMLTVQQWTPQLVVMDSEAQTSASAPTLNEHWTSILSFELDEYDKATEYAMNLSLKKMAPNCADSATSVDSPPNTASIP